MRRMTGRAPGFDSSVVNVASPTIRTDLATSDTAPALIIGGYAFAYAAGLIPAGRLGDLLGYKRMFTIEHGSRGDQ